jgi:hypothetical protein
MGRPRKRRRAEEVEHEMLSGGPAVLRDDGTSTSIQPSRSEDILASTPIEDSGLDKVALSWDPSQLDPRPVFDLSDWDLAGESGQYFNEDGVVPLHLSVPTDTLQTSMPGLVTSADEATSTQITSSEASPPNGPSCACLANLYLTLSSFQSLPPPSFPLTSGNLKIATNTARDVLRCRICPKAFNSAFQNISLLGTLLPLIIMEYAKLLHHIDEKSASGESILFRMGDLNPALVHLHTGTPDCPLGFNIELSAVEWRMTARKVIRQQVLGIRADDGSLNSLIDELEERQHAWHNTPYPHNVTSYTPVCATDEDKGERGCLRVIKNLRRSIEALKLSDDFLNLS